MVQVKTQVIIKKQYKTIYIQKKKSINSKKNSYLKREIIKIPKIKYNCQKIRNIMKQKKSNLKEKVIKPMAKIGINFQNQKYKQDVSLKINGQNIKSPDIKLSKQKIAYSGGFKISAEVQKAKSPNKAIINQKNQIVDSKQQFFKQFGLTNQENYNKKNSFLPKSKDQLASQIINNIQSNIQKIRFQRQKIFAKQLKSISPSFTNQQYILKISEANKQQAIHIPSSLQDPTLQNIAALHQAHKQYLKPIQQDYIKKKGNFINFSKQQKTIQQQTENVKNVIYKLMKEDKKQMDKNKKQENEQQYLNRLFQQRLKMDPKLAEYDAKYKQYLIEKKVNKKMESNKKSDLFHWDKYKQSNSTATNTNKIKVQKSQEKHQKQILQQIKQQKQINRQIQNNNTFSGTKYDLNQILITKNDKYIAKYIFKQIDTQKKGLISKSQLFDYCLSNQLIKKQYNINQKWFYSDLDCFQTQRKGIMNSDECIKFLLLTRNIKHPQIVLNQIKQQFQKNDRTRLTQHQLDFMEGVFKQLDVNNDKIILRQDFISHLFSDPFMLNILDMPAIRIDIIKKNITVRQILQIILKQYTNQKNPIKKKVNQYITLNQFLQYFKKWQNIDLTGLNKQKETKSKQIQIFDIQVEYLQLLQDVFNCIPRIYQNYICVKDFLQYCRSDHQIKSIDDQLCRIQSIQTKLKLQNISMTLQRMYNQCDQFDCWQNLKYFFSRRGRPQNWSQQKLKIKKQLRQKEKDQFLRKIVQNKKNIQKKQNDKKLINQFNFRKNEQEIINSKLMQKTLNYTIPKPPQITDIIKAKQKQLTKQQIQQFKKKQQQLKCRIKALPLNRQILEPKYSKIQQQRKLKSQKNRQMSKQNTKNIEKPFSFYQKQLIAKTLKEAALKYDRQQLYQMQLTQVKATQVVTNLKKPYKQVIDQNIKKKSIEKTKPIQISKNLYPDNPQQLIKQKNRKVQDKMKKMEQIQKRREQQLQMMKKGVGQKNKKKLDKLKQKKKRQEQLEAEKLKINREIAKISFEPKINNYVPENRQDRQNIQSKKKREQEQKMELFLKKKEQERKKRLQFKPKQQVKLNVDEMAIKQIIEKLNQLNIQDLLQENQKVQYLKEKQFEKIPFSNNKKMRVQRMNALKQRQRQQMENQQRRRRQQIRQKQNQIKQIRDKQKQKTFTNQLQRNKNKKINVKDQQFQKNLQFHKSKALRRYRDIMQGKKPLSEYDRMSNQLALSSTNRISNKQEIIQDKSQEDSQNI